MKPSNAVLVGLIVLALSGFVIWVAKAAILIIER